jgi:hypothetical protein
MKTAKVLDAITAKHSYEIDWLAYAISVIGRNPVVGESTVQAAAREL